MGWKLEKLKWLNEIVKNNGNDSILAKTVLEKAFQEIALIHDGLEYDNLTGVLSLKSLKGMLLGKPIIGGALVLSYSQGK